MSALAFPFPVDFAVSAVVIEYDEHRNIVLRHKGWWRFWLTHTTHSLLGRDSTSGHFFSSGCGEEGEFKKKKARLCDRVFDRALCLLGGWGQRTGSAIQFAPATLSWQPRAFRISKPR